MNQTATQANAAPPAPPSATIQDELARLQSDALGDILNRVEDIDNCYRSVAEKMGQLYMCMEEQSMQDTLRTLDKPMRNASDNNLMFAALLDELRMAKNRQQ